MIANWLDEFIEHFGDVRFQITREEFLIQEILLQLSIRIVGASLYKIRLHIPTVLRFSLDFEALLPSENDVLCVVENGVVFYDTLWAVGLFYFSVDFLL